MASESDLRTLLQGPEPEGRAVIDVDTVLRRARARRRPRVIAASAVGAFALAGVLTPAVLLSQQPPPESALMVAEDSAAGAESVDADEYAPTSPTSAMLMCGAPLPLASASGPLALDVTPVSAKAGADDIPIEIALRNDGDVRITGVTGQPSLALTVDGTVLWHTPAAQDLAGIAVDLEPGEAMTYVTTFQPLVCDPAQDGADQAREDLAAVGPGAYELVAAIDFVADDGTTGPVVVTGPAVPVELR